MEPTDDVHQRHLYEGEPDEDLISALEPDQLVQATDLPLPAFRFGRGTALAFVALRVFVLVVAALAIYVFVESVVRGS